MDTFEKQEHIKRLPIFSQLEDTEITQLEPLFTEQQYKAGEYVYRQAEYSFALYLFLVGRGRLLRVGDDGIERSGADVDPGEFVGEKTLFLHDARPNSLVILRDATVLVLARRDFESFVMANPTIKARLNIRNDVRVKAPEHDFHWLNRGEIILRYTHRHIWAFYRRAALALPLFLLLLPISLIIVLSPFLPNALAGVALGLNFIISILYVIYTYFDWENDWFVVTNQRVLREEKVLFTFSQMRKQAPLESIQTVHIQKEGYFEERLDFGNLVISTAGAGGNITFDTIPTPEILAGLINNEIGRTSSYEAASDREHIRSEIDRFLGTNALNKTRAEDIPQPGPQTREPAPVEPVFTRLEQRMQKIMDYLDIRVRIDEGFRVVYRTHWMILWRALVGPIFALIVLLFVIGGAIAYHNVWPWNAVHPTIWAVVFMFGIGLIIFWMWWEYEDWHNDLYIVEDMMLTHIHRRPLWFHNLETSIPIKNIQGVNVAVIGIWQQMLNYGTVIVQTAADSSPDGGPSPGEIPFDYIYQPHSFQEDVLRRLREGIVQDDQDQQELFSEQIARWLAVYHQATNPDAFDQRTMSDFMDKGQVAGGNVVYKSEDD
ncbi:cyclic nucleotide-binding domain-containing protein [Chloroflexota bacterium]